MNLTQLAIIIVTLTMRMKDYMSKSVLFFPLFAVMLGQVAHSEVLLVGAGLGSRDGNGRLLRVDPDLSAYKQFGDAQDFNPMAGAMVQDSLGRIYVLEANRDRVQRYDLSGTFIDTFASADFSVNGAFYGMAIDANDNVFISSDNHFGAGADPTNADDSVVGFDSNGNFLGAFGEADNSSSGFAAGGPLIFDHQGNLFASVISAIQMYGPTGVLIQEFPGVGATSFAFSPTGDLYFSGSNGLTQGIHQLDISTGQATLFASSVPAGIAFDRDGNLFESRWLDTQVRKYAPDGSVTISSAVFPRTTGSIYVAVPEPNALFLFVAAAVIACPFRRGEGH